MPKINTDLDTFPNIVIAYLFDKMLHPDDVSKNNKLFNEIIESMDRKGFLTMLRKYYLSMDADNRVKYKLIKKAFTGTTNSNTVITIVPKDYDKPKGE